jgi:hypothetical protein
MNRHIPNVDKHEGTDWLLLPRKDLAGNLNFQYILTLIADNIFAVKQKTTQQDLKKETYQKKEHGSSDYHREKDSKRRASTNWSWNTTESQQTSPITPCSKKGTRIGHQADAYHSERLQTHLPTIGTSVYHSTKTQKQKNLQMQDSTHASKSNGTKGMTTDVRTIQRGKLTGVGRIGISTQNVQKERKGIGDRVTKPELKKWETQQIGQLLQYNPAWERGAPSLFLETERKKTGLQDGSGSQGWSILDASSKNPGTTHKSGMLPERRENQRSQLSERDATHMMPHKNMLYYDYSKKQDLDSSMDTTKPSHQMDVWDQKSGEESSTTTQSMEQTPLESESISKKEEMRPTEKNYDERVVDILMSYTASGSAAQVLRSHFQEVRKQHPSSVAPYQEMDWDSSTPQATNPQYISQQTGAHHTATKQPDHQTVISKSSKNSEKSSFYGSVQPRIFSVLTGTVQPKYHAKIERIMKKGTKEVFISFITNKLPFHQPRHHAFSEGFVSFIFKYFANHYFDKMLSKNRINRKVVLLHCLAAECDCFYYLDYLYVNFGVVISD